MERDTWSSNLGFLLAAVGSAIGLGNIWRFSYVCHKNGGGSFLVPYFIALFVTGIPLLILEFVLGHKMRGSAPKSMHQANHQWEWLGWWPVIFVMFGIELYYVVVIGWCARFVGLSLQHPFPWVEPGSQDFFFHKFLHLGDSQALLDFGGISWPILGATFLIWLIQWFICIRRVQHGVERACKVFIPLLLVLTAVLVFWGLTLEGAMAGIQSYLSPDPGRLGDVQVWRDAFGQIFFSLSLGFGIMIAYASYLPRRTDLVRSATLTAAINCGYSIFAGFAVFTVLGYMAHSKGCGIDDVAAQGAGLCFVVYPEAIANLPAFNHVFGFCFFLTLVLAGLTSAISIVEAFAAAVVDKFGWKRAHVVTVTCALGFLGSVVFTTHVGLFWLDIVDHFLNSYGLVVVGLLECIFLGWFFDLDGLRRHLHESKGRALPMIVDLWWEWSIKFATPAALVIVLAWSVLDELATPYEGYPKEGLIFIGFGWVLGTLMLAGLFSVYTKHRNRRLESEDAAEVGE